MSVEERSQECPVEAELKKLPRAPIKHHLKIQTAYFHQTVIGEKRAQLRLNDRDYRVGDKLCLHEYDPEMKILTGPEATVTVTDMIEDCDGLTPGWCILSVEQKLGAISSFNNDIAGKHESEVVFEKAA